MNPHGTRIIITTTRFIHMDEISSGGGTVDAADLKSAGFGHEGSTPSPSTR